MPRIICKVQDGDTPYYFEWSTIVDAPVTYGMSLDDFKAHYRDQYGEDGMRGLDDRLKRVELKGVSSMMDDDSLQDLVAYNRAGEDETCLTLEQIVEWYCRRPTDCNLPRGT